MPPPRIAQALMRTRVQQPYRCLRSVGPFRYASTTSEQSSEPIVPWKTPHSITSWPPERLIPPPKEGELLLERKPNRDLPPVPPFIPTQVRNTFPIFVLTIVVSALAFFNYQKQESSVVSSTLYALRTNAEVRDELGDEIYFASKYPWIKGEINQVHGRIDISFWVKGTKREGQVKLRCRRRGRAGYFVTQEYTLTMDDGRVLQLYDPEGNAVDPFQDPLSG
ncbi:DUF1783-domain-containing protein [Aaosphaeria arxii CBS 175.79]|uniref:DUF1783-domain-containing protein n=1 Tax=Aaosphaeria arxii CBS 175.79 TaxID=1450172 RepID=A0A6A5XXS1_9PLEO|nr:DUF1783-domain-containing protein [Aaosphaeria arxii CBS 175.79]KAF2018125.1 DUF1783-domain-containing protein [Aaosphaeria arxii CBS 175.79]